MAQSLCGEDHIVKGASLLVSSAVPKNANANYHNRRGDNRPPNFPHNAGFGPGHGGNANIWNQSPYNMPVRGGDNIPNLAQLSSSLGLGNNPNQAGGKGMNTTPPTLSMGALNLGAALPLSSTLVAAALNQAGLLGNFPNQGNSDDCPKPNANSSNAGPNPNMSGGSWMNQPSGNNDGPVPWNPRDSKGYGMPVMN